jgi:hypothetical protein
MKCPALWFFIVSIFAVFSDNAPAQIGALPNGDIRLEESKDPRFRVGDIWEYKTRPGEERSRITILRIEASQTRSPSEK